MQNHYFGKVAKTVTWAPAENVENVENVENAENVENFLPSCPTYPEGIKNHKKSNEHEHSAHRVFLRGFP